VTDILTDKQFSRGAFLKGGGTLVVGFSVAGAGVAGRASAAHAASQRGEIAGPPDPTAVDSWIALHKDNTATIYLGKVELGQGSPTGLLQIAGEELDLAMDQLKTVRHDTNVTPNQGFTSGSQSISGGGPQVRQAAAEARQALLGLASSRLGVPAAQLMVDKGVVSGGGKTVKYGDLLGDQLFNVKFTGTAPQKKVSDYKLVTSRAARIDIPDKVTGKYTFLQNVRVPGMLHGRVVRPKGQGAWGLGVKPLSIDERSIAKIPGAKVVRKGDFVGVVAPHEYGAIQAAAQLKVKWAENPVLPTGDLFGAMRNAQTRNVVAVNTGSVEGGLAQATTTLSNSYSYGYQGHMSLGPMCSIADVKPGSATVLASTQDAYVLRTNLAKSLNLPVSAVRVQYYEGSGVYGGNPQNDVAHAAAIMSQLVGKPVRVQLMRWDEHGWDNYGPAHTVDLKAAVDKSGKIVAYDYTGWMIPYYTEDTAMEQIGIPIPDPSLGFTGNGYIERENVGGQYAIANKRLTTKAVPAFSGYFKTTFLRAPSAPQALFASEQMVDELAVAAGMDPVEFRRKNIESERWLGALNAVVQAARWQPKVANSKKQSGTVVTGRGVAIGGFAGSFAGIVADVEVNLKTGKIVAKHLYGAQDAGLTVNPALVENQIEGSLIQGASRALMEEVKFSKTNVTSLDWVSYPIMRFKDAPKLTPIVVQRTDQKSSGSGEPPLAPVAAAIANAFFDATGVRLRQAPMTPAVVRAALKAAGK
jgi:nicotinate dehydrogenase subunit B